MNEESPQPPSEGIKHSLKKIIKNLKLWGQQDIGIDPNNLDKISEETKIKMGKERDRRLNIV